MTSLLDAAAIVERVNEEHGDAVEVLVRAHGAGCGVATWAHEARLTALDRQGITLAAGPWEATVPFGEPIVAATEVAGGLARLVAEARRWLDDDRPTSIEVADADGRSARLWFAEVVRVDRVTARLAAITLAGPDLAGFPSVGPDASVYLLLPPPGSDRLTVDRSFTWERWATMPEVIRPVGAHYTVRSARRFAGEIDLLVVLHGGGHASLWAASAAPGDAVALWGPRSAFRPPATTRDVVLFADETGLPALASIVDALPAAIQVRAFVEVADATEHVPLARSESITWIHRNGAPPGTTDLLVEALSALRVDGATYLWGAAERRVASTLRGMARRALALTRDQVCITAYWSR